MAEGRSTAAIAGALVINPEAVEKHVANIFGNLALPVSEHDNRRVRKFGGPDVAKAGALALRCGWRVPANSRSGFRSNREAGSRSGTLADADREP
jgi:hypothetical protein